MKQTNKPKYVDERKLSDKDCHSDSDVKEVLPSSRQNKSTIEVKQIDMLSDCIKPFGYSMDYQLDYALMRKQELF